MRGLTNVKPSGEKAVVAKPDKNQKQLAPIGPWRRDSLIFDSKIVFRSPKVWVNLVSLPKAVPLLKPYEHDDEPEGAVVVYQPQVLRLSVSQIMDWRRRLTEKDFCQSFIVLYSYLMQHVPDYLYNLIDHCSDDELQIALACLHKSGHLADYLVNVQKFAEVLQRLTPNGRASIKNSAFIPVFLGWVFTDSILFQRFIGDDFSRLAALLQSTAPTFQIHVFRVVVAYRGFTLSWLHYFANLIQHAYLAGEIINAPGKYLRNVNDLSIVVLILHEYVKNFISARARSISAGQMHHERLELMRILLDMEQAYPNSIIPQRVETVWPVLCEQVACNARSDLTLQALFTHARLSRSRAESLVKRPGNWQMPITVYHRLWRKQSVLPMQVSSICVVETADQEAYLTTRQVDFHPYTGDRFINFVTATKAEFKRVLAFYSNKTGFPTDRTEQVKFLQNVLKKFPEDRQELLRAYFEYYGFGPETQQVVDTLADYREEIYTLWRNNPDVYLANAESLIVTCLTMQADKPDSTRELMLAFIDKQKKHGRLGTKRMREVTRILQGDSVLFDGTRHCLTDMQDTERESLRQLWRGLVYQQHVDCDWKKRFSLWRDSDSMLAIEIDMHKQDLKQLLGCSCFGK